MDHHCPHSAFHLRHLLRGVLALRHPIKAKRESKQLANVCDAQP